MKKGKGIETLYRIVFASIAALAMLFSVCNAFSFTYDTKVVIPGVVLFALIVGIGGEKQRRYMPFLFCVIGELLLWGIGRTRYTESIRELFRTAFLQLRTYFAEGRYAEIERSADQTWGLLAIGMILVAAFSYTITYDKKVRGMKFGLALSFFLPFLAGNVLQRETLLLLAIVFFGILLGRIGGAKREDWLVASGISLCVGVLAFGVGVPLLADHLQPVIMDGGELEKRMDEFWSGDIRDVFSKLGGDTATGGVNDGALGNYAELERDDRVHLKLATRAQPARTVYVRGFVGGEYTGHSWKRGDEKRFETESEAFDIQNIKANRKYQYHTYPDQNNIPSQWEKTNSDYEKSVQKKYSSVPDRTETAFRDIVQNEILRENPENVMWEIAELLRRTADYTWYPGKTPAGKDFAEYFFFENKKGYCTHFATTAVLLFRMKGIPARYVAGYSVEPEKFVEQEDGTYLAEATGENAHAWAEIYVSGKGWIPAETTPGYVEYSYESEEEDSAESDWIADQKEVNRTDHPTQQEEQQKEKEQEKKEKEGEEEQEQPEEPKEHDEQGKSAEQEEKTGIKKGMLFGILGILLIIFLFIGIFFFHKRKRKNLENKKGYSERTKETFYGIYKTLVSEKVLDQECELDESCIEKLVAAYPQIPREDWSRMLEIVYRANYGKNEVTKEEYLLIKRIVLLLEKKK